jgi:hypothetical protein
MTIYYICRAADVTDLELSQTFEEQLACEIVTAARIYDEISVDLLAIKADSENGMYAQIKGAALFSMELNDSNIQIWQTEAQRIYEYLLGPAEENSRIWSAFGTLHAEMEDFEALCNQSKNFNELAEDFSSFVASQIDESIREEQSAFADIMEDLYSIEELKTVTS